MNCTSCSQELTDSQIVRSSQPGDDVIWKSCPNCSVLRGVHVYYDYEDFGFRDMGDDRVLIQSWCAPCRSAQAPVTPSFVCSDRG